MAVSENSIDRRLVLSAVFGLAASMVARPRSAFGRTETSTASDSTSLDQMIGEMIVMGFWGSDPTSPGARAISSWLRDGLVGGVIFFEDNLPSPHAATDFIEAFREAAGESTPFLCLDQEGGAVARLRPERGFERLPAAKLVGTLSHRT